MNKVIKTQVHIPDSDLFLPCVEMIGSGKGPSVLITAGIHGGESLGIRAVMRLMEEFSKEDFFGKLIFIPCCNEGAFYRHIPYSVPADGKNLLRVFPGSRNGSLAQRIAFVISGKLSSSADYYIDVHSGDIPESLFPHVYYSDICHDYIRDISKNMAVSSGLNFVVKSKSSVGSIQSAVQLGVPSVLTEMGYGGQWNERDAERYSKHLLNILHFLGVTRTHFEFPLSTHITDSFSIYSDAEGCWYPSVLPGDMVSPGMKLGEIRNYCGDVLSSVSAKEYGVILYARNALSASNGELLFFCGKTLKSESKCKYDAERNYIKYR